MEHLELILTGVAVVMSVLLLLWAVSAALGFLLRLRVDPEEKARPKREPPPHAGIPPHHVAAITAAVAAMTPGAFRIVNVRAPALVATTWAEEGRYAQTTGHRVRWDWTGQRSVRVTPKPNQVSSNKDQS